MKTHISKISLLVITLFPFASYAQELRGVRSLLTSIGKLINMVIPILFGLSLIYFFWGIGQFILHDAGNDKTREEGKKKIIWGVIALFVFVSIYGILYAVGDLVGIKPNPLPNQRTQTLPTPIIPSLNQNNP